jgi:hypothetical protein
MIKEIIYSINEKRYYMGKYNDIDFYVSDHFLEQELKRSDITPNEFEDMMKLISKELKSDKNYDDAEYLFFIKKYQQGFILHWIPEKNRVNLITYLPRKKSTPKDGTKKIIIENYDSLLENYFDKIKKYLWIDENIKIPKRGINTDFSIDVTIL